MAGVQEVWNNAVKVGNTQVRESKERGARPVAAAGTTCWPTFHPMAFVRRFKAVSTARMHE